MTVSGKRFDDYEGIVKRNGFFRLAARVAGGVLVCQCAMVVPGIAQTELDRVLQEARTAWLEHEVESLVRRSDTVRLNLPRVTAASLRPMQAARLLANYLKPTREVSFDVRGLRTLAEDHAYAEVRRVFLVLGTEEERQETVFLGFRRLDGQWRLREVRVMP